MGREVSSITRIGTSEPFELQVARGQVAYHKLIYKFGHNQTVGQTEETIWSPGGLYSYPAAATTMTVSSTSAADAAAGTGARTVQLFGLDTNYNEISETVTMNGQTPVTTTKSYLRINRGVVLTAGSGGENAGNIYAGTGTVTAGVPANIYLNINGLGDNQTLMCLWTVPAGYTAYMTQYTVSTGTSSNTPAVLEARLVSRPFGGVFNTRERLSLSNGALESIFFYPLRFDEKTDIEVRANSTSGAVDYDVSASFRMVYILNGAEL
jgi:hypothetical protein